MENAILKRDNLRLCPLSSHFDVSFHLCNEIIAYKNIYEIIELNSYSYLSFDGEFA